MKFELQYSARSRSGILASLIATFVFLGSISGFCDGEHGNWSRDIVESATGQDIPVMPFYVGVTTSVDGRISALCGYHHVKGTENRCPSRTERL